MASRYKVQNGRLFERLMWCDCPLLCNHFNTPQLWISHLPKKEYQWQIGESPPPIEPHSFAKHRVYEEYIRHYIEVSYANPRIPAAKITLVDGFSGGGQYTNPQDNTLYEGSPTRLIRAAESAAAAINTKRESEGIRNQFQLHTTAYFVEKNRAAFDYLKSHLATSGIVSQAGRDIHSLCGDFLEKQDAIVQQIQHNQRAGRAIFILDQYGWSDVPFPYIQRIFANLSKAEVILTFATDWLIDYLSKEESFKKAYNSTGLHEYLPLQHLLQEKKDSAQWRSVIQAHLHRSILASSGARYYTPFFIKSTEANKSFWLLHLSNHPRARDVMTGLHWRIKNQFSHHLAPGIRMFGYDPSKDEQVTGVSDLFGAPEYAFDEDAHKLTHQTIQRELPTSVYQYDGGISFQSFYEKIANHTPATMDHIKATIASLIDLKEIEVVSPDGKTRNKASTIKDSDILQVPRQTIFLYS